MPPSRRKVSCRSAAAAAAARQKYKVGDLVLAKVKGFPAWPATVSEPDKWGYSTDWKKVLVYFFGTKQIGFCNPADVEAFTEEKKKILLVKRQGKGADFVRAVDEIIDCYEKLKKQSQDEFNSGDEGTASNAGSSEGPKGKSSVQSPLQAQPSLSETPFASLDRIDSCNAVEVPLSPILTDGLHDVEPAGEEPIKDKLAHGQNRRGSATASSSLRKRSTDTPKHFIRRRPPSVRRSRSSSRVSNSHKPALVVDAVKALDDLPNNITDEPVKNQLIRKSPDSSVSAGFVSNCSSEDVGSEIVAAESETVSLTEGSTLESGHRSEFSGKAADTLENGVETSAKNNLHPNTVVFKKKRKPNRKRVTHDIITYAKLDKKIGSDVGLSKSLPTSPEIREKSNVRFEKTDGDEHLPLVKRARARMGKQSPEKKQADDFVDYEDTSVKEDLNCLRIGSVSVSYDDRCPSDIIPLEDKEALNTLSPSKSHNHTVEAELLPWKAKKYHLRGNSFDGEASLPPSKRLHRALEAMSANVAEAGHVEDPKPTELPSIGNRSFTMAISSCVALDNKVVSQSPDETNICETSKLSLRSSPVTIEETKKASTIEKPSDLLDENISSQDCKEINVEMENCDVKDLGEPSVCTDTVKDVVHSKSSQTCSFVSNEKPPNMLPSHIPLEESSLVKDESNKGIIECGDALNKESPNCWSKKPLGGHKFSPIPERPGSTSRVKDAGKASPSISKGVLLLDANGHLVSNGICGSMKISPLSNGDIKVEKMYEATKEVEDRQTPKYRDLSPDSTSLKVLIAAAQEKRHFCRATFSDHISEERIYSDIQSNAHGINVTGSSEKVFPVNTSNQRGSALDCRIHLHDGNRNSDASLHQKNSVHVHDVDHERRSDLLTQKQKPGRWIENPEANAAWRSFETLLGTLSRTKESIGRATRLAMDCAKFGVVDEVVEVILQSLEHQSSLHRRVDLFFLVDSIAQCSRGQKGVVGELYLSAVQAVLPRLLSAAAPPGNAGSENRRQCLKVLRVWLERKTLPESIVRRHIRELDSFNDASVISSFSRRPPKTERAFNDPVREMEGMLVDEYGSNTGLSGFHIPCTVEDDYESLSDEKSFEAVTPEQDHGSPDEAVTSTFAAEKHPHILEDVDGELEMEDVAPSCEDEMCSGYPERTNEHASHCLFDQKQSLPFVPPLPEEMPPSPPPLPSSPPPTALPPPPPAMSYPFSDALDSQHFLGTSNHSSQSIGQQPVTPKINSTPLDTRPCYAPGYGDSSMQMLTPIPVFTSSSYGVSGTTSGSDIQKLTATTLSNTTHPLQPPPPPPPPPTMSNQFSYVQVDSHQRAQSWMDCSSSFTKKSQFVHETRKGNVYEHNGRTSQAHHEADGRCSYSTAACSGPVSVSKVEVSYASVSCHGSHEHAPISNHGRSFPPGTLNYRHPAAIVQPPLENQRVNGAPNHWRPR